MRIWSLHPKYLDTKGLVALWRETLLAKHVLEGKTKGYTHHPQLIRFKKSKNPINAIHYYLKYILKEAQSRNYNFDGSKVNLDCRRLSIKVTSGQMQFESKHLLKKLKLRDKSKCSEFQLVKRPEPHPMFKIVQGEIEEWEIL